MTPKEKAKELVDKFIAKQLALIAVDEMLNHLKIILEVDKKDFEYWQEVKQEIELL